MAQAQPTDKSWNGKRLLALTTIGWLLAGGTFMLFLYAAVPALA